MRIFITTLVLFLCCIGAGTAQKTIALRARVIDADSATGLRFATIRLQGTTKGTFTDRQGYFLLRLAKGDYTITISMVGYSQKQLTLSLDRDTTLADIAMQPMELRTEEVVVTAKDPARALMEAVLATKERQRNAVNTYSYSLYSKFVFATDTLTSRRSDSKEDSTIFAILETFSKGYYSSPDRYFNQIIRRRQTANLTPQTNILVVGTNISAYEDKVAILGDELVTPFHPDALDLYTFTIEKTYRENKRLLVKVKAKANSSVRKMLEGTLLIEPDSAVPVSVRLTPTKAVQLPLDASLRFEQTFTKIGQYIMPEGLALEGSFSVNLLWLLNPRLDFSLENIASDYEINVPVDDELFEQRRVEVAPAADVYDTTFWRSNAVMPLKIEEEQAYTAIQTAQEVQDSVAAEGLINQIFAPVVRVLNSVGRRPFTGFEDIFRFNRVHGAYLGMGLRDTVFNSWEATIKSGYGISDQRWYGELGVRHFLDKIGKFSVGANGWRRLQRRDNPYIIPASGITFFSLLAKNDYGDYFYGDGGELFFEAGWGQLRFIRQNLSVRPTTLRFSLLSEYQTTAMRTTDFAFFGKNRSYRENPAIFDGTMRSIMVEANWNHSPFRRLSNFGVRMTGEYSDKNFLFSDYSFSQATLDIWLRTPTLPAWRLDLRIMAGASQGEVPPQRFFSFETALASTAAQGVFRSMAVKEFYGDNMIAIRADHSFGEVIPGILRIPNLASFGVEFIASGALGWSGFSEKTQLYTGTILPTTERSPDERFYGEAGIGFNRLLLLFRVDVSARFTQRSTPQIVFTLSAATF
jgi:hypothetical protein